MLNNKNEELVLKEFLKVESKNKNATWIMKWKNGLSIEAIIDTMYDSDNCDDDNFEEYFAILIKIIKITKTNSTDEFYEGQLVELNYHNFPNEWQIKP